MVSHSHTQIHYPKFFKRRERKHATHHLIRRKLLCNYFVAWSMQRVYCLELWYDSIYYLDPSPSSALNIRIWFWNISVSKTYFFFGFIYILRTTGRNQLLPRTKFILFFKKIESRAAIQKWRSRHLDCGTFETLIAALDCDTKLELRQCRSVTLRGTGAAMPISANLCRPPKCAQAVSHIWGR